ncbi:CLUMA_CG014242, isoform A [Clunio marinus]|uniref:pH-sensitive chloride channel 2 n=1 Tax=Clunio marinus TaxID=568069 RepID=A0A1J1IMP2_9DIPT|nr:CLUMA_CG014242, isoform A [Clunio marinus]
MRKALIAVLLKFMFFLTKDVKALEETTNVVENITQIILLTTTVPSKISENSTILISEENSTFQTNTTFETTTTESSQPSTEAEALLIPPATVPAQINRVEPSKKPSRIQAALAPAEGCPSFENADSLTQTQLFKRLTHPCRFDRIQRPEPKDDKGRVLPVNVYTRAYIYYLQNLEAHDLQFKIQALLQFRFVDPRLVFKEVSKRTIPIVGEDDLRKELWVPHIFFANENDLRHGAFAGNYSSLSFTVTLSRQMGFYLIDYFLPSMMIVAISWVTFWLQADQTAPRIMLGTTTMLTFITLASAQGKTLPKVNYIKASEIWFMGCTGFIFGTLVEFAFVNTIWRRRKNVELKKVNTSNILKQTLTPRPMRKEMASINSSPNTLQKSHSCSSIKDQVKDKSPMNHRKFKFDNSLTVQGLGSIPTIMTESVDDFKPFSNGGMSHGNSTVSVTIDAPTEQREEELPKNITWTTMTPQQISIWIDKMIKIVNFLILMQFAFVVSIKNETHEASENNSTLNVDKVISLVKLKDAVSLKECPPLTNADSLTQTQFFERLVHPCRYDRIQRAKPHDESGKIVPVDVFVRFYVYFLQNLDAHDLQFKMHALLQFRYYDPRLSFSKISNRTNSILGEDDLRKQLWMPHIFIANEKESGILGTYDKDILTSITPHGIVTIYTRIQASIFCSMDLRKFPFDKQHCKTVLESWKYNTSEMMLRWESNTPIKLGPNQRLTEYLLTGTFTNESIVNADLNELSHGDLTGNYSTLSFTFLLSRQIGFYMIDYFVPSMMIVATSWVTFWLQADQTAPRGMLGCTTMLTFITLATSQGKSLPKVSYIKASEIWFFACLTFIFASLAEFAFVNIIWRRRKYVELEKVNTSNILKETLTRKISSSLFKVEHESPNSERSCTANVRRHSDDEKVKFRYGNHLTVDDAYMPRITVTEKDHYEEFDRDDKKGESSQTDDEASREASFTTMTPREISNWIDRRSRVFFPCAFIVFNICYWTFVNIEFRKPF